MIILYFLGGILLAIGIVYIATRQTKQKYEELYEEGIVDSIPTNLKLMLTFPFSIHKPNNIIMKYYGEKLNSKKLLKKTKIHLIASYVLVIGIVLLFVDFFTMLILGYLEVSPDIFIIFLVGLFPCLFVATCAAVTQSLTLSSYDRLIHKLMGIEYK